MDFIFNLYLTLKVLVKSTLIPFVIPFVQFLKCYQRFIKTIEFLRINKRKHKSFTKEFSF